MTITIADRYWKRIAGMSVDAVKQSLLQRFGKEISDDVINEAKKVFLFYYNDLNNSLFGRASNQARHMIVDIAKRLANYLGIQNVNFISDEDAASFVKDKVFV